MREAKNRRVTAFFFDVLVVGSLFAIPASLLISLTTTKIAFHVQISCVIIYLLSLILYHSAFAKKVTFCSPGESMAGCTYVGNEKKWFTIFNKSRWFLFITLFLLLLNPANSFDTMQRAMSYPLPLVIGTSLKVMFLLFMIYQLSKGKFAWSIGLFIYLLLQLVGSIRTIKGDPATLKLMIGIIAVQLSALLISIMVYRRIENEQTGAREPSAELQAP